MIVLARACDSLIKDWEKPDLAKDCGYSKRTIQYLEWTGFILSFILFVFSCKLGNAFFYGTATTFCFHLIVFTIAVSNEDRINNLTTMAIIQQIFVVTSTIIIFKYEILYSAWLIFVSTFILIFILLDLCAIGCLNRKYSRFSTLQHYNLIFNATILCFDFMILISNWLEKTYDIYQLHLIYSPIFYIRMFLY